jgi:hypothetical protein
MLQGGTDDEKEQAMDHHLKKCQTSMIVDRLAGVTTQWEKCNRESKP